MWIRQKTIKNKEQSWVFSSASFQFRSRSLLRPSQFAGQPCSEQLVDSRRCFPTKLCNIEEVDCRNKFQCENGNPDIQSTTSNLNYYKNSNNFVMPHKKNART